MANKEDAPQTYTFIQWAECLMTSSVGSKCDHRLNRSSELTASHLSVDTYLYGWY